jgi:hypothetical protein
MITRSIKKKLSGDESSGGGGGSKTEHTIPEEFRPYIHKALREAEGAYDRGALSQVAGASSIQDKAFGQAGNLEQATSNAFTRFNESQSRLSELADKGNIDGVMASAAFNAAKAQAGIGRNYGATGTLGSARQRIETGTMEAEMTDKARQQVFQNKLAAEQGLGSAATAGVATAAGGASALGQLGDTQREIEQQKLDSTWQGIQRLASTVYGNPARQQAVQSGGGGGGK